MPLLAGPKLVAPRIDALPECARRFVPRSRNFRGFRLIEGSIAWTSVQTICGPVVNPTPTCPPSFVPGTSVPGTSVPGTLVPGT